MRLGEDDQTDDRNDLIGERDGRGDVQTERPVGDHPDHRQRGDRARDEDERLLLERLVRSVVRQAADASKSSNEVRHGPRCTCHDSEPNACLLPQQRSIRAGRLSDLSHGNAAGAQFVITGQDSPNVGSSLVVHACWRVAVPGFRGRVRAEPEPEPASLWVGRGL